MFRQGKVVVLVVVLGVLVVVTAVWGLEQSAGAEDGFIVEFPVPQAASQPQNLVIETAGPPSRIWFTMAESDAIGRLVVTSTVDFAFTTYSLTAGSEPFDIAYDGSLVWFTEPGGNRIGQLDPVTGMITETAVPDNYSPLYLDVDGNGNVWFTELLANQIVRYQPDLDSFTSFVYNFAAGEPTRIEVLNPNSVWITAPGVNRVAELVVANGSFVNIPVSDIGIPAFPPDGLALDSAGPWVTAPTMMRIGRYAEGTVSFWRWYVLPMAANSLAYTGSSSQRQLWFTSQQAGQVGRLVLDSFGNLVSFGMYALPTANSQPTDIAVAADGVAWVVESDGNKIAAWYPPYFYQTLLPFVSK
ncbi:MAG: hypothetical protein H6658_05625 [Ardenticatenaceae bacterium]|nr:hypothetical protein [Ardenticatenaceae bacterium]